MAECVTEWEVRLLNVRLLNGRLKCQAKCEAELKNMMLNVRVKCEVDLNKGEAGVSECCLSFRSTQAEDRDQHRLFARRFIEGFTNPYRIEYECAAGECAANLQSVQ